MRALIGCGAPVGVAWRPRRGAGVVFQAGACSWPPTPRASAWYSRATGPRLRTGAPTRRAAPPPWLRGTLLAVADGLAGLALVIHRRWARPPRRRTAGDGRAGGGGWPCRATGAARGGLGRRGSSICCPEWPTRLATFLLAEPVADVALLGRDLGVVVAGNGALIVDLQAPEAPTVWLAASTATPAHHVAAEGRRFAVATDDAVQVFEVVCPEDAPDAGIPADGGPP
ncbi:MAG: hypothetical protein R3F43_19895 [bacterium]